MNAAEIVAALQHGPGYAVIPDLMPRTTVQTARDTIVRLAGEDRATGKLIAQHGRWRLRLTGRGDIFKDFAAHDLVADVAERILGTGVAMGGLSAHALTKGAPPQGVHVDYPYSVMREPFPEPPMQLQAIWTLDDFTPDNGATRVLPHSQKSRRRPDKPEFYARSTAILCPAGSLILSHGGLWHDSSTNRTEETRIAILGNYTPFWVRSVEGLTDAAQGLDFRAALMKAVAWKREDKDGPKPPY
ncbi:MAG: phytanoyl-CoA dioxygenase family protein [Micropepsaceae bacterium]